MIRTDLAAALPGSTMMSQLRAPVTEQFRLASNLRAVNDDCGYFLLCLMIVVSVFAGVGWLFGKCLRKSRHMHNKDAGGAKQQRGVEAVDHIRSLVGTVA